MDYGRPARVKQVFSKRTKFFCCDQVHYGPSHGHETNSTNTTKLTFVTVSESKRNGTDRKSVATVSLLVVALLRTK
jgi:hypothetical protein